MPRTMYLSGSKNGKSTISQTYPPNVFYILLTTMLSIQTSELAETEKNPEPFFTLSSIALATTSPSTIYFISSPDAVN